MTNEVLYSAYGSLHPGQGMTPHLCFEQAQPKMYHSPKVDDGVDVFFKISWKPIFGRFFFEEFKTDITPKPLELFD